MLSTALTLGLASTAAAADRDAIFQIASILSGTFEGSTPGNHLRLNTNPVNLDPAHPYDLFLQVSGQFEKTSVAQQGVIRLETQGRDIYFTYIPHFNPAVTSLSLDAGRFTERELTSACSFVLNPKGDGFVGDTLGTTSCALAMQGAVGKWSIELEPGNFRLRNTVSGQTLRFRQVGKKEKSS
jgi:hypothetical protein